MMKTMKTTAMIIVTILITNLAMAAGNLKVNFLASGSDNAKLEITNAQKSQFEIVIKDAKGDAVFYKRTNELSDSYKKVYDFSRLEDGDYTLTVKIDTEFNQSSFKIDKGNIVVLNEKKIAKPYFSFDGKVFKMSYLNFNNEALKLSVYGEEGLLKTKEIKEMFAVHEGFDFSKAENGLYRVIVEHGLEMFQYDIVLD